MRFSRQVYWGALPFPPPVDHVLLEFSTRTHARGFPGGASGKESACQWRRHKRSRFNPCVSKIPWRRKWLRAPVFLPGKFHITNAAAAKSLQSCPTLCDPRDSSPPGSPVPGILQARTLDWVAISF